MPKLCSPELVEFFSAAGARDSPVGEGGPPVVNRDQPDRLPNVVRLSVILGFLLPPNVAADSVAGATVGELAKRPFSRNSPC